MEKKQFKMMLPEDVKAWLAKQAKANLRSQSQEIVLALREKMERQASEPAAQK